MSQVLQCTQFCALICRRCALPASSVVWYQNETDKATAEDVATTLGISAVEQVQGLAVPITVVLLN